MEICAAGDSGFRRAFTLMKNKLSLIVVTSLTALFVATCAAIFSVAGISKLFAGAALSAAVMATALELGKIVSISFLYQYWKEIPNSLRVYLTTAAVVLMLITSAGIYGYLSSAYAKVSVVPLQLIAEVESIDNQVETIDDELDRRTTRLDQMIQLRLQQENRLDSMVVRTQTGNTLAIRNAQASLNQADQNVTQIQNEISGLSKTKDSLRSEAITKRVEVDTDADIGTFLYIAKMFGVTLDTVVKWFTLIIVLVFDPLAVALVIAVNFLIKRKTDEVEVGTTPIPTIPPRLDTPDTPPALWDQWILDNPPATPPPAEHQDSEKPHSADTQVSIQEMEKSTESTARRDKQFFTRGDFDWNQTERWKGNPIAERYFKEHIAPLQNTLDKSG